MSQRGHGGRQKAERAPSPPITSFFQRGAREDDGGGAKRSKTSHDTRPPREGSRGSQGSKDTIPSKPPLPPVTVSRSELGSAHNSVPCTPTFSQGLSQSGSQPSPGLTGASRKRKRKTFHDCIYGQITFHPLLVAIIDTVEFQRLRKCKQLGAADLVYPSATHTRFEHCLGVAHRAGKVVKTLREEQPGLQIDDKDDLCVQIAGLCHDLGHGPFSHAFETLLHQLAHSEEDAETKRGLEAWTHEENSAVLFRRLLQVNLIDVSQPHYGALSPTDITFICEMITGTPSDQRRGRPQEKCFLYEIVNNIESGLDVDKLDYLQRDMDRTLGSKAVTFERVTDAARVCTVQGAAGQPRRSLCYPEKQAGEAAELFAHRNNMHDKVYQHRKVLATEAMVLDVLLAADAELRVSVCDEQGRLQRLCSITQCALDPAAFTHLDDSVLDLVRNSAAAGRGIERARELLGRLARRELYQHVGSLHIDESHCGQRELWGEEEDAIARSIVEGLYEGTDAVDTHAPDQNARSTFQSHDRDDDDLVVPDSEEEGGVGELSGVVSDEEGDDGEPVVHCSQIGFLEARKRKMAPSPKKSGGGAGNADEDDAGGGGSGDTREKQEQGQGGGLRLRAGDLKVIKSHVHHGAKSRNPVDRMWFYYKDADECAGWEEGLVEGHKVEAAKYRQKLPNTFNVRTVIVLCREPSLRFLAVQAVKSWCSRMQSCSPLFLSSQDNSRHRLSPVSLSQLSQA